MRPAAEQSFSLRLERSSQGLAELGGWVDLVTGALGLPRAQEYALRLCLEEAVSNVVTHGTPVPGIAADTLVLLVHGAKDTLSVTIEDDCAAFNPLAAPAPAARRSLEEPPGGWGIQLMRRFASGMVYERVGCTNRLTLRIGSGCDG